jgi:ABC-type glycerol-3-phosphate transport system substrate-binding protein
LVTRRDTRKENTVQKRFRFLLAVVLVALALVVGVEAKQRKLVALNVSSAIGGTEKAVAEFTRKTGIEVEVIITDWSGFDEKLPLMLAGGQQLDLIRFDQGHAAHAALRGWLVPLSPLIARDRVNMNVFPKPVVWHAPYDLMGEIYTLPYNIAISTQFYNRSHFSDAGLGYPPTQYGHEALQIDNWASMLKKLQRIGADGKIERWGTMLSVGLEGYYLLGMFGVDWVTPRVDRFLGATPEVANAYTRMINLWLVDGVAPKSAERSGLSVRNGNLSTQVMQTGAWIAQLDPEQLDLGVAPLPWGTTSAVQGGINSWGISQTCTDVDAAWEFVKYFTCGEGLIPWLEHVSQSPLVNRQYARHWVDKMRQGVPNADLSVVLEAGNYFWNTSITLAPAWNAIRPAFEGAIRKAASGAAPVAVAMGEIEAQINSLLLESPLLK